MGGRGVVSGGGGAFGGGGKPFDDNSGVGISHGGASATNMIVGAYGSDAIQKAIDYVDSAMKNITGEDRYVTVQINGEATGSGAYAWMYPDLGIMGLNTNYLKYDTDYVSKSYDRDVAAGFHPKGTTYKDIMVHEAAHRLDGILTRKIAGNNVPQYRASTYIVKEAINEIKKSRGGKGRAYDIQKALSGYGANFYKNHTGNPYVETFAEAIADYNANGKNANPLSKQIARITQDYIKKYR